MCNVIARAKFYSNFFYWIFPLSLYIDSDKKVNIKYLMRVYLKVF